LHDLDEVVGGIFRYGEGREPTLNPLCTQSASVRCWPLLWRKFDQPATKFAPANSSINRIPPTVAAVRRPQNRLKPIAREGQRQRHAAWRALRRQSARSSSSTLAGGTGQDKATFLEHGRIAL
jgi:hypothetical protein